MVAGGTTGSQVSAKYPCRSGSYPYPTILPLSLIAAGVTIVHPWGAGRSDAPLVESQTNGIPSPATMPTITLLGGDATQDDYINIFDLALIASHYGASHPADPDAAVADINGDNKVDIYDLAITAGNSGVARGPQPW